MYVGLVCCVTVIRHYSFSSALGTVSCLLSISVLMVLTKLYTSREGGDGLDKQGASQYLGSP